MGAIKLLPLGAALLLAAGAARAADPESCQTVRFSDVGWTDITSTTAATATVLQGLGYQTETEILAVPVTYASLKNQDIDVFLGNWMPTMEADARPYLEDGSVESVGVNLEGAKYTLAVPTYLAEQGLKDFADIAKFREQLDGEIYGIEPGNDGNRLILQMIEENAFGLEGFELVESSRAGHAGPGRPRDPQRGADRVPRLGAAPDERQLRAHLSLGRRRRVRPELRRRHRVHQRARGLSRRMPERRSAAPEPEVHPRDGERDHGRDPGRGPGARGGGERLAEGASGRARRPGSRA